SSPKNETAKTVNSSNTNTKTPETLQSVSTSSEPIANVVSKPTQEVTKTPALDIPDNATQNKSQFVATTNLASTPSVPQQSKQSVIKTYIPANSVLALTPIVTPIAKVVPNKKTKIANAQYTSTITRIIAFWTVGSRKAIVNLRPEVKPITLQVAKTTTKTATVIATPKPVVEVAPPAPQVAKT
ncbi:hypothetical protein TI03_07475, partial [Achromatium sp. WMS1]